MGHCSSVLSSQQRASKVLTQFAPLEPPASPSKARSLGGGGVGVGTADTLDTPPSPAPKMSDADANVTSLIELTSSSVAIKAALSQGNVRAGLSVVAGACSFPCAILLRWARPAPSRRLCAAHRGAHAQYL
jgi:hypothetical protein